MVTCIASQSPRIHRPPECASFVGRARELAELESLLLGAQLEPAPVVVVHGRRGIGKTTLAAALAQRASAKRIDVVWAAESPLQAVPEHSLVILDGACDVDAGKLDQLTAIEDSESSPRLLLLCRGSRYRLPLRLASWLDRRSTQPGVRFLTLRPLPPAGAEALIRVACGAPVSSETVAGIARSTAGDPSLIKEFARILRRHPELDVHIEVPETVAGLVAVRLATLDEDQRRVAETASLFSGGFAVDWLASALELSESETLAALRSAEEAGLVEQRGDDRFRMSAPVVREATRSLVFGGNLQRAHRRLADALIALPVELDSGAGLETARQYHSSRQLPGADRGVEPALQAAGHALAARTPLRAAELLELGLELCARDQPAMRARLTGALAQAWASALCHSEAVATLERACRGMRAVGAGGARVAELVVEVSCALPLPITSVDPSAPGRIRNVIGEVDERVRGRLDSVLGWRRPEPISRVQLNDRMARIAGCGDDRKRTTAVFRAAAETIEVLVDPELVGPLLQMAVEQAELLGSGPARSLAYAFQAVAAGRSGDLAAAGELSQAGVDAHMQLARTPREPPLAHLVQLLTQMHADPDWAGVAASARRLAADHWPSPYTDSLTALVAVARVRAGDRDGAHAALLEAVVALQASPRDMSSANAALGPAVEAAWRLDDARIGERLEPIARRVLEAGGGDFYMSQRDLTMARLAVLAGRWDEAEMAYGRASAALDCAAERTLRTVVDAERQLLDAREVPSTAPPDGLTGRQLEVLVLLSSGLTNQQIAERLVVSINTVHRHVADIYRKIGVANRVGAAAYVARHRLAL